MGRWTVLCVLSASLGGVKGELDIGHRVTGGLKRSGPAVWPPKSQQLVLNEPSRRSEIFPPFPLVSYALTAMFLFLWGGGWDLMGWGGGGGLRSLRASAAPSPTCRYRARQCPVRSASRWATHRGRGPRSHHADLAGERGPGCLCLWRRSDRHTGAGGHPVFCVRSGGCVIATHVHSSTQHST